MSLKRNNKNNNNINKNGNEMVMKYRKLVEEVNDVRRDELSIYVIQDISILC